MSVKEKHIDHIWCLVCELCNYVPCVLLKDEKKSKDEFMRSQAKTRSKKSADCASVDANQKSGCSLVQQ